MSERLTRPERVTIAAEAVRRAVKYAGPNPSHHRQVMDRVRRDAPVLWYSILQLIHELEKSPDEVAKEPENG